jgi:hypothetical protein
MKYPHARPLDPRVEQPQRQIVGDELEGLRVAVRIAEQRELVTDRPIRTRKVDVQHDLEALAPWENDTRRDGWHTAELGSRQFAAWRDRLKFWTGADPKTERIWLEPHNPAVHGLPATHPDFRLRKSVEGLRVPSLWPPRKDGTFATEGEAA